MMCKFVRPLPVFVLLLLASVPVYAREKPASEKKPEFIRFVEDKNGGGKLQTAIVTYKNSDGVTVHLVAALHVGEKSYYKGLSQTFDGYDALLYEMIKPKDSGAPEPGAHSTSMISMFQRFLKDVLELDFQLDDVDYTKENFVHADL